MDDNLTLHTRPSPKLALTVVIGIASASVISIAIATLLLTKTLLGIESQIGLGFLFAQRDNITPPQDIVIIAANNETAKEIDPNNTLKLTGDLRTWPRTLHAKLIDQLHAAGASAIVFDVLFKTPTKNLSTQINIANTRFAQSIAAAGNVLLFSYLEREATQKGNVIFKQDSERTADKALADAAVGNAIFGVATDERTVTQYWSFRKQNQQFNPTLATIALQLHTFNQPLNYAQLMAALQALAPNLHGKLQALQSPSHPPWHINAFASLLKTALQQQPDLSQHLKQFLINTNAAQAVLNFIDIMSDKETRFLNFYGGPQTITTIPYHTVIQGEPTDIHGNPVNLKDKAVFIGYAENIPPGQPLTKQIDAFPTPVTRNDGVKLHGVEIMATAFGNLLENRNITQAHPLLILLIISLYAVIITWLLLKIDNIRLAIIAVFGFGGAYAISTTLLFNQFSVWLPITAPLFQTFFILVLALLYRYVFAHQQLLIFSANYRETYKNWREAQKLSQALKDTFGHFLPPDTIDHILENYLNSNFKNIANTGQSVKGICIATDIIDYSKLAEKYEPSKTIDQPSQVLQLFDLLNEYYKDIMTPVSTQGGIVTDLVGDAMIAVWHTNTNQAEQRENACTAALNIKKVVESRVWKVGNSIELPTRIGLHAGEFVIGTLGAHKHFEYRAVGDTVNTATRLENLNKLLGTSIIASSKAIKGLNTCFLFRELGTFSVHGKNEHLNVYELMEKRTKASEHSPHTFLREKFVAALSLFKAGNWQGALSTFKKLAIEFETDGPTQFYIAFLNNYFKQHPTSSLAPDYWLKNPTIYTQKSALDISYQPFPDSVEY